MHPRIFLAIASLLIITPASAAYMPDNNGRHVYQDDHAFRRAAGFGMSYHTQRVRVARERSRTSRRLTRSHRRRIHHDPIDANGSPTYAQVHTANGLTARVAARAQDAFQGFIDTVEADRVPDVGIGYFGDTVTIKGNRITDIGCLSRGHMRHSKHHWGGACDFGQKRRDVTTDKFMYHVTEIAHEHGLTDGCEWDNRDCGHIEVPGPTRTYSAERRHRHHRYRYARR